MVYSNACTNQQGCRGHPGLACPLPRRMHTCCMPRPPSPPLLCSCTGFVTAGSLPGRLLLHSMRMPCGTAASSPATAGTAHRSQSAGARAAAEGRHWSAGWRSPHMATRPRNAESRAPAGTEGRFLGNKAEPHSNVQHKRRRLQARLWPHLHNERHAGCEHGLQEAVACRHSRGRGQVPQSGGPRLAAMAVTTTLHSTRRHAGQAGELQPSAPRAWQRSYRQDPPPPQKSSPHPCLQRRAETMQGGSGHSTRLRSRSCGRGELAAASINRMAPSPAPPHP